MVDELAFDGHRRGSAPVEVDGVVRPQGVGDRGRLVHRGAHAGGLSAVDRGEDDPTVAGRAGDGPRGLRSKKLPEPSGTTTSPPAVPSFGVRYTFWRPGRLYFTPILGLRAEP
jgi:hypothetical protein